MYYTVFAKARFCAPSITTQACYRPSLDSRSTKSDNVLWEYDFRNEPFGAERAECKGSRLPEQLRPPRGYAAKRDTHAERQTQYGAEHQRSRLLQPWWGVSWEPERGRLLSFWPICKIKVTCFEEPQGVLSTGLRGCAAREDGQM